VHLLRDSVVRHRRAMRRLLCTLAIVVLSITACGGSQRDRGEAPARPFDARLGAAFDDLERGKFPVVVAVSHDGAPAVVREFGVVHDDGVAAEQTLVDMGSITKTVTGVAVSKLVEQEKVRLDETLAEIFSDVPADKAAITVEQLLTHSGGFADSIGDDFEELSRNEFLRKAFGSELVEAPGTRYAYSNVGYSILAAIIEVRSGRIYEEYLRAEVLAPAGLDGIGYLSVYDEARSLRSSNGESIRAASWGGHNPSWHLIGNGGLVTTAGAFVGFVQALSDGKILKPSELERLRAPHVREDEAGTSYYGYGLVVQDLPKIGRFYWHDGGNGVFSAEWAAHVDQGDVIFVAGIDAGADEGVASAAMSDLRQHLYGES
jgi:CubicO group peptidase (beta-lactamase class C family)